MFFSLSIILSFSFLTEMIELSGTRFLGIPPRPTIKNIIIRIEKKGRECLLDFGLIWGKWQVTSESKKCRGLSVEGKAKP